ncbi:MAG TPA: cysteine desulfurase family protein [Candidatus Saccharimonadales bacterium]|nr:cysteine desulfurase family protein [Candidatus Saccharimonadales bacterium]
MSKAIYLDYAAATPVDPQVLDAMQPYFSDKFYNPSANYLAARAVRQALEQARSDVASCLGARPAEVIFTAGATEANNLAIQGAMRRFPDGEVLVSSIEHESVLEPASLFKHRQIPVDAQGRILLNKLSNLINDKTVLISVGFVNNELGSVQPMREIADIVGQERKKRRANAVKKPLWLHTDAAQAPNYFDLHVSRLGVDLVSINGGKVYGPKQSGALYVKAGVTLTGIILGGGQESNLRSGTENVPGAIGLAEALKLAQDRRKAESQRISTLRQKFIDELKQAIPDAVINGSKKSTAPHILSVSFPGVDNERLMFQLDEAGVQVAAGSACAAGKQQPSHVLAAVGLSDELIRSTLRISLGRATKEAELHKFISLLRQFTTV